MYWCNFKVLHPDPSTYSHSLTNTHSYRVDAPGLLTSKALQAAGYKPNNSLRDQRTALLWLQKHLPGFGGDPSNITLAGESAGGISVCYHLFSKEPLFKRMVPMSGTQLLIPPISADEAEKNYRRAVKTLGVSEEGAVKELVTMDGNKMPKKLGQAGIPTVPVLDGEICPTTFDFGSIMGGKTDIPGLQWCEAAVIGDCQFDGNIQSLRLARRKGGIGKAFYDAISKGLEDCPGVAGRLFEAYGLNAEAEDDEVFFKVLQVANDIYFYVPTLAVAQNLSAHMRTHMYRFNESNPWDGPWKGYATHILDVTFLLQNFNEFLESPQRETAERYAIDVIKFMNGKEPWEEWKQGEKNAKVYGAEGREEVVEDIPSKVGRRSVMLELDKEVGFDKLSSAFDRFMKPAPPPV